MTALTRSAYDSPTKIAAAGTFGTSSSHRAFPIGLYQSNGVLRVLYRRATSHSSNDGVLVTKTCSDPTAATPTWSAESVLWTPTLDDRPGGLKQLASGRIVATYYSNDWTVSPYYVYPCCRYSDDNGATWSSEIAVTTGLAANHTVASDFVQLANGDLICILFGQTTYNVGDWKLRCSRSTDEGATWTDLAEVATISGLNCVEPQVALLADGTLYCTFHTEDGLPTDIYYTTSTNSGASWSDPETLLFDEEAYNRDGMIAHPDGDIIETYWAASPSQHVIRQSTNNGASYGSRISFQGTDGSYIGSTWCSPVAFGDQGVSPNLAVFTSFESSGQLAANIYCTRFTRGSDVTAVPAAAGYGNTTSSGYGAAEAFTPPPASLTIDPASGSWEQIDTSIIVRVTADGPASVPAVVTSTHGGLVRFRGTDADLFDVSLDGTTWASTVDVPIGETDVFLRVTPETPGTTLAAEIGVPV